MHHLTLLNCVLEKGNDDVWSSTITALYEDVEDTYDLMRNLAKVPRRIAPTTQAMCVLMPSQKFLKAMLSKGVPDNLDELVSDCASRYWAFYVDKDYEMPEDPAIQLETILSLYESFHLLEVLPQKWGKDCLYKCNCVEYFKMAMCWHVLLLSWVMDPTITCPSKWIHRTHQSRRKRGRPSDKGEEGDDTEKEEGARSKAKMGGNYKLPTVR
jgi:hypothetical protein